MLFLSEQSKEPVDSWSGMAVDLSPSFSPVSSTRKGFAWIASAQSNEGKYEVIKSEENIDDPVHSVLASVHRSSNCVSDTPSAAPIAVT